MLEKGTQIIYVPLHAKADINHPDCQEGFVTSVRGNTIFCRYWSKYNLLKLRTKTNSEGADKETIVIKDTHKQSLVDKMLEAIENDTL